MSEKGIARLLGILNFVHTLNVVSKVLKLRYSKIKHSKTIGLKKDCWRKSMRLYPACIDYYPGVIVSQNSFNKNYCCLFYHAETVISVIMLFLNHAYKIRTTYLVFIISFLIL